MDDFEEQRRNWNNHVGPDGSGDADLSEQPPGSGTSDLTPDISGIGATPSHQTRASLPSLLVRLVSRRRVRRAAAAGILLLLVFVLIFVTFPGSLRTHLLGLFPHPIPTATIVPGADQVYFIHDVPWGTLRIDGKPSPDLNRAPRIDRTGFVSLPWFTLPRGRHALRYTAVLFPTLSCILSVPAASGDNCPLLPAQGYALLSVSDPSTIRILDLSAALDRLPPAQRAALLAAIQAVLAAPSAPASVAVGERYLGSNRQIVTAREPLAATPLYTLNTDPQQQVTRFGLGFGPDSSCAILCELNYYPAQSLPRWRLEAHVIVSWRYERASDQSLVLVSAPSAPVLADRHLLVNLDVQWSGQWYVAVAYSPPICGVGANILFRALSQRATSGDATAYQWLGQGYDPQAPAQGCVVVGSTSWGQSGPIGTVAYVFYRFGVVLAANAEAHHLLPQLPVATPAEQAMAARLATMGAG